MNLHAMMMQPRLTRRSSSRVSSDRLVTRTLFSSRRRMLSPSPATAARSRDPIQLHTSLPASDRSCGMSGASGSTCRSHRGRAACSSTLSG